MSKKYKTHYVPCYDNDYHKSACGLSQTQYLYYTSISRPDITCKKCLSILAKQDIAFKRGI